MSGLLNDYFGPLGREYCLYFYLMSIFFFVMIILGVIGIISAIITYYINNPLAPFQPLQQFSVEKDIYKIFCKWEDDHKSILNILRI